MAKRTMSPTISPSTSDPDSSIGVFFAQSLSYTAAEFSGTSELLRIGGMTEEVRGVGVGVCFSVVTGGRRPSSAKVLASSPLLSRGKILGF